MIEIDCRSCGKLFSTNDPLTIYCSACVDIKMETAAHIAKAFNEVSEPVDDWAAVQAVLDASPVEGRVGVEDALRIIAALRRVQDERLSPSEDDLEEERIRFGKLIPDSKRGHKNV